MLSIKAKSGLVHGNSANLDWLRFIPLAVLFLIAVSILFGKLGDFPLFNPDEGYYAEPAREMLVTGEYVTTPLNYVVRYTKPPLIMWAMIFCYKIFGVNEFAARFFGAACGVTLVVATYLFLEKFLGSRIAVIGGLSLITAPLFFGVAREAITDMPLALFTAGSLMAFFIAFKEKNQILKWLGYVLVGLAVMTKGPIGALLPGLIMFVFYMLRGQAANAFTFFQLPIGCLVVSLIALPWFITEIVVTNGGYFREFIWRENFERFTSVIDAHKGAWWYHIAAIFGGFLPWSVFLPQAVGRFFGEISQEISKSNVFSRQFLTEVQVRLWTVNQTEEICLFAICWSFITVAFFSASVSKLLPYTLPAFPALAMLVSIEIERCIIERKKIGLLIPIAALTVVYGAGIIFAPQLLSNLKDAPLGLSAIISSAATFLFVSTLIAVALIWKNLKRQAIWLFTASFLFLISFYGQQMLPIISAAWEGKIPAYAQYAARTKDSIVVFDMRKPGIPFYTKRKVIQPADRKALNAFLNKTNRAYIITRAKNIPSLESTKGVSLVASDNKFALLLWQQTL